jgi:hypothetical protein
MYARFLTLLLGWLHLHNLYVRYLSKTRSKSIILSESMRCPDEHTMLCKENNVIISLCNQLLRIYMIATSY